MAGAEELQAQLDEARDAIEELRADAEEKGQALEEARGALRSLEEGSKGPAEQYRQNFEREQPRFARAGRQAMLRPSDAPQTSAAAQSTIPDPEAANDMLYSSDGDEWEVLTGPTTDYMVLQRKADDTIGWDWVRVH